MTSITENPYAPPKADVRPRKSKPSSDLEVWREGNLIVCPNDSRLPERCVVCNDSTNGHSMTKIVRWHHPAIYLVLLVNLLVYIIVALAVQKKAKLTFSLCQRHRVRRTNGLWLGYLGFFASLAAMFIGFDSHADSLGPIFGVMGIAGAVIFPIAGFIMTNVLHSKRIKDGCAHLKLGEPFVDSIPHG